MTFTKPQQSSYQREEGYARADMKASRAGRKAGGRAKKADGGILDDIANALAGRGYIDGSTWLPKEEPMTASDKAETRSAPTPPRRPAKVAARPRIERENPQLTKEYALQERYPYIDETISGAEVPMQSGRFMKKGGKVKKANGGGLASPEEAIGSEERLKGLKVMPGKSSTAAAQVTPAQLRREEGYADADMKAPRAGRKTGGRTRSKGKTHINIVIAAGRKEGPQAQAPDMTGGMPSAPAAIPVPMPGAGGPPPAAMPMGGMPGMPMPGVGAGAPPMPPGRKAGGRITKVAKSYKDMEAGAATGEGRLQKTDIAKLHKGAPARKSGGRAVKSYKDMTAGAESGKGRLQKMEIEKSQRLRGR